MDERAGPPGKAVQFNLYGDAFFLKEIAIPFADDVLELLREEGFSESLQPFSVPGDLFPTPRMTNVVGADTAVLGISLFLGTSVGGWAVGKVCDYAWGRIQSALDALTNRFSSGGFPSRGITFHFGVWYDADKVYVLVSYDLRSSDDFDDLESVVAAGHRAAVDWIQRNGTTSRVLVFRAENGEAKSEPEPSDSVPLR